MPLIFFRRCSIMAQEEREENMFTESMDEEDLRSIIADEIRNALKGMDFSKQTKVTTITSGTLDEQINRAVKSAVKEVVSEEMKTYKEEVDKKVEEYKEDVADAALPNVPTSMVPVYDMTQGKQESGMKTWQKVALGVLGALAVGGAAYAMGKGSNDSGNFLDGDMPD
jgi:hypothetical protein